MDWLGGRIIVVTVALALPGLYAAWPSDPRAGPPASCGAPVMLAGRLVCDPMTVHLVTMICPSSGVIRVGDRLDVGGWPCRIRASALSAGHRLRLGLALDVNRSSAADLRRIAGIGPRTAERIVRGRPWPSVDALDQIKGVGPTRLGAWRPMLRAAPRRQLWPSPRPHAASSPRRPSGSLRESGG